MFQEEEWAMLPVVKYCYCIWFTDEITKEQRREIIWSVSPPQHDSSRVTCRVGTRTQDFWLLYQGSFFYNHCFRTIKHFWTKLQWKIEGLFQKSWKGPSSFIHGLLWSDQVPPTTGWERKKVMVLVSLWGAWWQAVLTWNTLMSGCSQGT